MSKIPCEVVQDLLPLYDDGICSEQSNELVEEHLEGCDSCTDIYKTMKKGIPAIDENQVKSDDLMAADLIKFLRKKSVLRDMIIALVIVAVFSVIIVLLQKVDTLHFVPYKDVELAELYELENGNIYCMVDNMAYEWHPMVGVELENGEVVMTIGYAYNLSTKVAGKIKRVTQEFPDPWVFNVKESNDILGEVELSRIVYEDLVTNKEVVIWKKGDELEKAPKEVEEYAEGLSAYGYIDIITDIIENSEILNRN